jgi:predicted enzyme related to lactoylglutathione lyase
MQFNEIAFSVYPVTDLKRAREFYERTLGLKPGMVYEGENQGYIEYEIGPGVLAIGAGSEQLRPSVALEVENFDAAIAELRESGAKFGIDPLDLPDCRMAAIVDPDGNTITIHQRKQH